MSDSKINLDIEVTNKMYEDNKTPREEPRDWYPSSQAQELVRKFHEAVDEPIGNTPQSIGPIRGFLRSDLIKNGLDDFEKAVNNDSLLDQYDTILEILLQCYGVLVEMGVDAGPGKREVMRSKMTMLNEVFEKPDLFNVLTKQGWKPTYEEYLKYKNLKDPTVVLQTLAGRPDIYEEVAKFVPDDSPSPDTLVKVKYGFRHDGVDYFDDEPHPYTERIGLNFCACGKMAADRIHMVDWDIDRNEQVRKDNFHDRVMRGWQPSIEEQVLYENHRQMLERKYPPTKVVDGKLHHVFYYNGEKDVDWDFTTNAPRVKTED